jgi:hypothetical protein
MKEAKGGSTLFKATKLLNRKVKDQTQECLYQGKATLRHCPKYCFRNQKKL